MACKQDASPQFSCGVMRSRAACLSSSGPAEWAGGMPARRDGYDCWSISCILRESKGGSKIYLTFQSAKVKMTEQMTFQIDTSKVSEAIAGCEKASPLAREASGPLVDAYIERLDSFPDSQHQILAIETPFFMWLAPKTLVVGVVDRISRDENGIYGHERKTKGAPKTKKDGTPYEGASEDDWLNEIGGGVQLQIYGLALARAIFAGGLALGTYPLSAHARILVRAVIKDAPPYFWPRQYEKGMFALSQDQLIATENALVSAAEQIRAARRIPGPWTLPGLHCTNKYRRLCRHHEPFCGKGVHPVGGPFTSKATTDPGWHALAASGADPDDPEIVVLSASSYANWSQCGEQYRLDMGGYGPREGSFELDLGAAYHAGIAEIERQIMEAQNGSRHDATP